MAFGLYIHIPYCVKKCPYCDFNSYGVGKRIPEREYTEAILGELELYGQSIAGLPLSSIFFGGGTPSLFSALSIGRIIDRIIKMTNPSDGLEISLEVNPKTADLEKLRSFRRLGINRISVGIQSFSERKLKLLGRINTPDDCTRILEDISNAGFENYNLDLMYGVTDETPEEWRRDLERATEFHTTHVSAYCLTIEDDTEFGTLFYQGKLPLPDEDVIADMIIFTPYFLERAGYRQYEISNFAVPGLECRHNLLYWRGENYLGLGAGAHSHFASYQDSSWGKRWANIKNPSIYMNAVREGRKPLAFAEILSRAEAIEDKILMGLRLREGINLAGLQERFGLDLRADNLSQLIDEGLIKVSEESLRLTSEGLLLSDGIILRLIDSLFDHRETGQSLRLNECLIPSDSI